jgi:Mrp family chromosome partitioning ATPase
MPTTIHVSNIFDGSPHSSTATTWSEANGEQDFDPRLSLLAVPVEGFLPVSTTVEELQLVQRLFFLSGKEKTPRVIVFSGVEPGTGAELVCARAAEILADLVKDPICLMDANLRAPTLHLRYEIDGAFQFSGRQSGEDGKQTELVEKHNLWVLPASALKNGNPGLTPDLVRDQLGRLRERFGFLLICAPPLGTEPEGFLLGQMADGVVLTLLARSTHKTLAQKVRKNLETYNIRLFGSVLNELV